jgi:hypothetical protein
MSHEWLDLIPYYVNRTLPDGERSAFERHLASCEDCRRALDDWNQIAAVVYHDSDQWARQTPVLAARVRASLGLPASSNGHSHYRAAFAPNETLAVRSAERMRRLGGRARLPLTMAAAVVVVLLFGALLIALTGRGDNSPTPLSEADETRAPALTLGAVTATPGATTHAPTPTVTPGQTEDLGIMPPIKSPTPTVTKPGVIAVPSTPRPPSATPTPTIYWPTTPEAAYQGAIGMGYLMVTTEWVGAFPAGTRVRISHATYNGAQWIYTIIAQDEINAADAYEWQIAYAPDVTPGPTPTAVYGSWIGSGGYLRTTEQVGAIPAGARVRIGSAWFDGFDWVYQVVAEDGYTTAEVRTYQLAYDTLPVYTPTLLPTTSYTPIIHAFAASPDPVTRGGTLTLSWDVIGADRVSITRLQERTGVFLESIADYLAASGSLTYTIPGDYISEISFILIATQGTVDNRAEAYIKIAITCPYSDWLSDDCPITQQTFQAAYQAFENGHMVWRGDTGMIYVLYNSGILEIYSDTLIGDVTIVPETPPPGRVQPVSGFGRLWSSQPQVRAGLGWGLDVETGYTARWETHQLWMGWNMTTGDHFTLPDGRVVHQTLSGWSF